MLSRIWNEESDVRLYACKEFKLMARTPFRYPEEIPDRPPRKKIEEIVHYKRHGQKHPPDTS